MNLRIISGDYPVQTEKKNINNKNINKALGTCRTMTKFKQLCKEPGEEKGCGKIFEDIIAETSQV